MTDILDVAHRTLRWSHIILGFSGLAAFWILAFLTKGTPRHVFVGRIFAWTAKLVGISAAVSALWAVLHVDSFAPWLQSRDAQEAAGYRELFKFFFLLLLYLGVATLLGATFGVNVMRYRNRHQQLKRTSLPFLEALAGLCAIWLVVFGVTKLCGMGASLTGKLPWAAYQIPVIVGCIGIVSCIAELRMIFGPDPGGREWLYTHIEHMGGTVTGMHTAFAVFGFGRITGMQFQGVLALVPWIVTPAVGIIATTIYIRRLRAKNGDIKISKGQRAAAKLGGSTGVGQHA